VLAALLACQPFDYAYADLGVLVSGRLPADAERVRICVAGVGVHEEGAGNGRIAVPGLPSGAADVRIEVVDIDDVELQQADAWLEPDAPWTRAAAEAADGEACEADGAFATDEQESFLLAISWAEGGCCSW
jgi:hypothetical protein